MFSIIWKIVNISFHSVDLEMEASIPQEKTLKLSSEEVKYCIYMLEKYGEDYKVSSKFLGSQ